MHGSATPRLSSRDPVAARIAALSAEFLEAGPARRAEIGAEVRALMAGRVIPLDPGGRDG